MNDNKNTEKKKFFKIPQTRYTIKQNCILGIGLILVLAGIFLLVRISSFTTKKFVLLPTLLLFVGTISLFLSLAFTQNSVFLFLGIYLVLSGSLTFLTGTSLVPLTMKELWPVLVIAFGVALFPAGFYKMKRIRSVYLFPALTLVALGVFFLMFSLHIFKTSLSVFISTWWPCLLILAGLVVVLVFIFQQSHSKDFPYMKDDSLNNDDDDDDK
ncbi:MAG: DUF5668 domain-containing protein [Treponema sp.]